MRQIKMFLAILVLTLVACRSVPTEVMEAHNASRLEARTAMALAEKILSNTENLDGFELNIVDAVIQWSEYMLVIMENRNIVNDYLISSKVDSDVLNGYDTGKLLLLSLNGGIAKVNERWADFFNDIDEDEGLFRQLMRQDIERFEILERKFHEWITQFKVKD